MSYFTDAFDEFATQFGINTDPYGIDRSARAYQYHLDLHTRQFSGTEAMSAFGRLPEFFAALDTHYYDAPKRIVPHDGRDIFTADQFTTLLGFFNEKFGSPQKDWEIKLLGKAYERLQHTRRSATKKDVLLSREVNVAIHSIQLLIYRLQTLEEARKIYPNPEEFDQLVKESGILEKSFLIRVIHDLSDEIFHEVNVASEGKSTPIDIHYSLGYFYLKREALENPPVDADDNLIPDAEVQAFLDRVADESKAIHYWKNKERYVLDAIASGYKMRSSDFKKAYKIQLEKSGYSDEDIEELVNLELKNPVSAAMAGDAKRDDRVLGTLEASNNRIIEQSAFPIVKKPQDIAVREFEDLITYFQNMNGTLTTKEQTNLGKLIEALVLAQDIQNSRPTIHPLIPASDIRIQPSLHVPEMAYLSKPTAAARKALFWVNNNNPALAKVLGCCTPITNAQRKAVVEQQQALQDVIQFVTPQPPYTKLIF